MTSARSCKNLICMMKEDILHRIHLFAVSMLAFFFVYPVIVLMLAGKAENELTMVYGSGSPQLAHEIRKQTLIYFRDFYVAGYDFILLAILAVIAGILGFYFLFRSSRSDFYHGLPFKRDTIYFAVVLDGLLMILLPCILMSLLGGIIVCGKTGSLYPLELMVRNLGWNIPAFLLCYFLVILTVMLTGQMFTALLMSGGVFFYMVWIGWIARELFDVFFKTDRYPDIDNMYNAIKNLSPVISTIEQNTAAGFPVSGSIVNLVLALILAVLCLKLYRIRPLEKAGESMVFEIPRFPLKVLVTIPAALTGLLLVKQIIDSKVWYIFALICTALLVHCILEILFSSNFKNALSHRIEFLICLVAAFAVFLIFDRDIPGYDRYLPDADSIESAGISCSQLEENIWSLKADFKKTQMDFDTGYYAEEVFFDHQEYIDTMAITDIDTVMEIARRGIEYTLSRDENAEDSEQDGIVDISWHLKGGKIVRREYIIDMDGLASLLDSIHDNPDFKAASYPLLSMEGGDLSGVFIEDIRQRRELTADNEFCVKLLNTYKEEFSSITMERRRKEPVIACLRFVTKELRDLADTLRAQGDYYEYIYDYCFYPVYPDFTKTIAMLEDQGVSLKNQLKAEDFSYISLTCNRDIYDENGDYIDTQSDYYDETDPARIQEILDASAPFLSYYNSAFPDCYSLDVDAVFTPGYIQKTLTQSEDRLSRSSRLSIKKELIPEYLKEHFSLTREDIDKGSGWFYGGNDR